MTFIENIPIGFGLGRNPKYWETVLSNCIKSNPVTLENNDLPSVERDTDILDIESVAAILKCSVDKIRRISRDELPARIGPGKKLLYHRADVLTYFGIAERAINANTWSERFFSFALAVDNFGEVNLTLEILQKTLQQDKSKYMKFSSALYFIASYLGHSEALEYCRTMALSSNSKTNMYRFKKLSRLLNELRSYLDSTSSKLSYPGIVSSDNVVNLTVELRG